jgi:hypothetical protein
MALRITLAGLIFLCASAAEAQQPATLAVTIGTPSAPATSVVDTRPVIPCAAKPGFIVASLAGEVSGWALASGDAQDFEISGHNVVVGKSGIAAANCGKPLAVTVVPTQ